MIWLIYVIGILAAVPCNVKAAELDLTPPTVRVDSGVFSGDRQLNSGGRTVSVVSYLEAKAEYDSYGVVAKLSSYDQSRAQQTDPEVIRELYASHTTGDHRIRVGRQIITLGKADGVNPSDVLTPTLATLLTLNDADQRQGRMAVRFDYFADDVRVSAIAMADDVYDRLPIPALPIRINPDQSQSKGGALLLDRSGGNIDWGLALYRGTDLQPAFDLSRLPFGHIDERHVDKTTFAADVATNFGEYGVRAELACTKYDQVPSGILAKADNCFLVFGGDRTLANQLNINLQFLVLHSDSVELLQGQVGAIQQAYLRLVGQTLQQQTAVLIRFAIPLMNENVSFEFPVGFMVERADLAVRPRLIWRLSDKYSIRFGYDHFSGNQQGLFGRLTGNKLVFVGLQVSF